MLYLLAVCLQVDKFKWQTTRYPTIWRMTTSQLYNKLKIFDFEILIETNTNFSFTRGSVTTQAGIIHSSLKSFLSTMLPCNMWQVTWSRVAGLWFVGYKCWMAGIDEIERRPCQQYVFRKIFETLCYEVSHDLSTSFIAPRTYYIDWYRDIRLWSCGTV